MLNHSKHRNRQEESGQVLIILALVIVVLLGFAALALDGGMIYSDRRHAQNSSDAAALAGGGDAALILSQVRYNDFNCSNSMVTGARNAAVAASITQAGNNDYTIDGNRGDHNGVDTDCTVYDNGSFVEKYLDVNVDLTSDVNTSLMQSVFSGEAKNEVSSIVRVYPPTSLSYGNAIVSLNMGCHGNDGGVTFDGGGNSDIIIHGGGVFSNSCIEANGSSLEICVDDQTTGSCDGDGEINYRTTYDQSGNPIISPAPTQVSNPIPTIEIDPPDCSSLPNMGDHSGSGVISPGRYSRIRQNSAGGTLELQPGLYCLYGEFTINGGTLTGENVTIYMASGDFTTAGNATQNLDAPPIDCSSTGCPPAMPGMLIYMDPGNSGVVTLQGDTSSTFEGTVFAPAGTIDLGGGSSAMSTASVQLIGDTVKIHGNVTIDILYDENLVYMVPPRLDVYR